MRSRARERRACVGRERKCECSGERHGAAHARPRDERVLPGRRRVALADPPTDEAGTYAVRNAPTMRTTMTVADTISP